MPQRPRRVNPPAHDPGAVTAARVAAGLTKAELARQVGVGRSMIGEIERGTRAITPAMSLRLAAVLCVDPSQVPPTDRRMAA